MTMINTHWGVNDLNNGYVNIYCPTIHENKVYNFSIKKEIYKELKNTETFLHKAGYRGWVSWTGLKNAHIMKFFRKINAFPYEINVKSETIWFKKEF